MVFIVVCAYSTKMFLTTPVHAPLISSQAGERHKYDAPVCSLVLRQLRAIETALFPELTNAASAEDVAGDISGPGDAVHQASLSGYNSTSSRYGSPGRKATVAGSGSIASSYNSADHMAALMAALQEVDGTKAGRSVVEGHPTLGEWWFWMSRLLALETFLVFAAFVFLHDY